MGNLLVCVGSAMVLVRNGYALLVGRMVQGFCTGLFSAVVPVMVKEYSPISLSGHLGMVKNIVISCGYVFGFTLALIFSFFLEPTVYWFYVFAFPIVIVAFQQLLLMCIFTSETPKYLIASGRHA